MARGHTLITDFTAGELSPRWHARINGGLVDTMQGGGKSAQYESACREITNMLVLPQGGVTKRAGMIFGRDLTGDLPGGMTADQLRVFTFEYTGSDFLTLWGPGIVRVYDISTVSPTVAVGSPVFSTTTPYTLSDVKEMHVAQMQDGMIVFVKTWRMRVLRYRVGAWALLDTKDAGLIVANYDFRDALSPPIANAEYTVAIVIDQDREIVISVSGVTNGASFSFFDDVLVGSIFVAKKNSATITLSNMTTAMKSNPAVDAASVLITYIGTGSNLEYNLKYKYYGQYGDGSGDLAMYPSARGGTLGQNESTDTTRISEGTSGTEPLWSGPAVVLHNAVYYRCILLHTTATTNEPGVGATWTTYWTSLGASLPAGTDWTFAFDGQPWTVGQAVGTFNRGWPSTGTAHEQRIIANGSPAARSVITGSRIGTHRNLQFTLGDNSSDAFLFLLAGSNGLEITWLHSQKYLFIGTSAGVYLQTQVPLTPTTVHFDRQSNYTLSSYRGFDVAGETFYVQRNGRQMRRLQYISDLDSWQATDITSYAEHLFTPGTTIVDQAYQNSTNTVLWILRSDGALLSLSYERFYSVAAWSKHATRSKITAMDALFGGAEKRDHVACIVERNGIAYLEFLGDSSRNELDVTPDTTDGSWDYVELPGSQWAPYVDQVQVLAGNGAITITVATRFANRSVTVVENGVVLGTFTAIGTTVTLPSPTIAGSVIYVGLNYTAKIVPVRYESAGVLGGGISQSQKMRWTNPVLRLFASVLPNVNGQPLRERAQDDKYDTASPLFTGDVKLANLGYDGDLVIEANQPLPFTMSGIFGVLTVDGG